MNPVVVIGAGLVGLSAACYLTGRRYDVTAVEREQLPGGRAGVLHRDGFTFDAGPTVLTMADLIADAVRAATGDIVPRSTNCSPRSGWTRHTEPASPTAAPSRPLRPRGDAGGDCPGRGSLDTAAFDSFVDWLRKALSSEEAELHQPELRLPTRPALLPFRSRPAVRLGAFGRLGAAVRKRFADPRLHRLFSFQAIYAGLTPDSAIALYAVITYVDSIEGVWFPKGGIQAVPTTMAQVAEKAGVTFRNGDPRGNDLAIANGASCWCPYDIWRAHGRGRVCTLDLPTAYEELLSDLRPPRATRRVAYSASAVLWHVGVRGMPEASVAHHNIQWARPLRR
jgi:phytoene desaturase